MSVLKKQYLAHRLVWLYVYGYYPIHTIDHINGIKTDNRICNLRDVSQRKNNTNKLPHRRGKLYGSYDKKSKKWGISISCKSVYINIRRFNSALSAHYAYIDIFNAIENEGDILGTVLKYTQTKRVPYITPIKTKWIARITQNGNRKTLGTYITKEEAALVYFNYYIRIRNTQPTKNALMELFMRQYDIENKPENIINLYRYI